MWQHLASIHAVRGTRKCSLLQTELKGLMDLTAYFMSKCCGSLLDPCRFIQLSARCPDSLSLAGEMQTGRRRRRKRRASFTVAIETLSSLLNTCLMSYTRIHPFKMRDSLQCRA